MADRDGADRGKPGEMESGGISPVIGDIERTTTASTPGGGLEEPVLRLLQGLTYPLARDDLVREAAMHGAGHGPLDLLTHLPDRVYASAGDVAEELQRSR